MKQKTDIVYIISDVSKSMNMEWAAEGLKKKGVRQYYILLQANRDTPMENFLHEQKIPCKRIDLSGKAGLFFSTIRIWLLLLRLRPHAVHCHLLTACLIGLTAAKYAFIRQRIYTRHHSTYNYDYYPSMVKWDTLCDRLATHIISISPNVTHTLKMREHVPASKIVEIAHGFDLNAFSHPDKSQVNHLKSKYNPENKFPVIGVISRWIELKGVQYIIPAFEKVLKQHPNALLLLFNANGNYTPALDLMFAKLPTSSAKKISFENDIVSLYQIFDVFVHVPVDKEIEAFGQTYIESLAAGVPSVFTLSGIANEVIRHEHNALVVPYRNADVIYEAIVRILGSAGLREKLVKSGKETASDFSISVQIDKLYRLYAF